MPLKLVKPRPGKTTFWSVRGTHLRIYVDKTTKLTDRRKASKVLVKWREEIERGQFAVRGEPTFASAAVNYVEAGGETTYLEPLAGHFGDMPLRAIDQQAIDAAAIALYPQGSAATRNRQVYTPMSAILKRAGIDRLLRRPEGAGGKKQTVWLWPEQAFAMINAADRIDAEFGILLKLLCYTGVRLGEALRLRGEDVRLAESFAYVAKTKNDEPRAVFLPEVVTAALARHPRGLTSGRRVFRFTKSGRLYKLLRTAAKAADVVLPPRSAFHLLRHTWATWMRRYALVDTRGLVGTGAWKDQKSAARYEHTVLSEDARKASMLPVDLSWKLDTMPQNPQDTADG